MITIPEPCRDHPPTRYEAVLASLRALSDDDFAELAAADLPTVLVTVRVHRVPSL